jgi:DNA-binding FadR family transcriptional regulator
MAEHQLPKLTVRVRFPSPAPPENAWLASPYGTTRNAAREAVRILSDAGLVITQQGRGNGALVLSESITAVILAGVALVLAGVALTRPGAGGSGH